MEQEGIFYLLLLRNQLHLSEPHFRRSSLELSTTISVLFQKLKIWRRCAKRIQTE